MREMKHSKKLAFAVLAAVTAVGANVNPVDAASVVMDNTNVVTGANNAVAYGSGNTVKESDANFRDRDYENEPDDATKKTGDWKSNSVAIGVNNTAAGTSALAMGNSSKALMNESIAIGHSAEAQRTWSTAIGTRAKASEVRSQAIGYEALASGYKSNAIGSSAQATNNHSVAMGSSALASGDHANATHLNSIALGTGSTTTEATAQSSATIAGHTFGGFAGVGSAANGSVSVGKAGSERQIKNVAPGELSATSTDAVNGSQLYSVANDLQTQINNSTPGQINNNIKNLTNRVGTVERRVNKVGAGSAALAALHPLDFNPDDKWTIAAGYGHYHNANSAALGAFYRPNEDTMFSVGGTVGTGETQLNAGVSIRLGKRSPESRSRVAMGREIAELNARLQDMENKYNNLLQILTPHAIDPSKTAEFPDVPRNHWAYQYISQLAGNGILVGYPDGTFKGDVKMTRYEFATMLYRALQNGAPIDENMKRALNEFGPELQNIRLNHFRVDRISGDDNDRHKTERVRVNNEPKNERDVYGSRIYNNQ
ncbi:S-layer homology domain-containing protein [Veillonella parvula]|uniref:S-layer homology domain-containing protein n=1 Tax=Veillonella parvula TaxID=29466 RepID=UPI0035212C5B